jgi:hypothetical protein
MKKITIYSMTALMLGIATLSTGCMGSWILTKKVYEFNNEVTGNKYANNIIFWLLSPVYGIAINIDAVILNLVEFWTGSNPIALKEGEKETQIVKAKNGHNYQLTATKNKMEMLQITGEKKGMVQTLIFRPETNSCSILVNGVESKIIQYNESNHILELFNANGDITSIYAPVSNEVLYVLNK